MVLPSARRQRRAVALLVSIKACVAVMLEGSRFHDITSFHGVAIWDKTHFCNFSLFALRVRETTRRR